MTQTDLLDAIIEYRTLIENCSHIHKDMIYNAAIQWLYKMIKDYLEDRDFKLFE